MKFERHKFALSVTLLQCFGIAILVMVGVWMGHYRGGFAWNGTAKQFNYHPIFMILSMVFLNSQAMMAFRVFRNDSKSKVKLLHMIIQGTAFAFGVLGLKAVFDFHNHNDITNMYSLHSWIGITAFVLFACQLACGFLGFLFPKFPDRLRAAYLKVHVFFGTAIFLLVVAACLTGITEKVLFTKTLVYKDLPPEGILINCLVVCIVIHAGLAYFIATNENFKRTDKNDEEQECLLEDSGEPEMVKETNDT